MRDEAATLENLVQELKRGTLVLSVLLCTESPSYGYALVAALRSRGMEAEQNTLYPLLRRLESQGLLESSWDTSDSRPRRYYVISEGGRRLRAALLAEWRRLNDAVTAMEAGK